MHPDAHTCTPFGGASLLRPVPLDAVDGVYASRRPFLRGGGFPGLQSFPDRHGGMLIEFSAIMFDVLHMGAYVGILL